MISSYDVIRKLHEDGWILKNVSGDHYQYVHPTKKGKVTVQHPKKDFPIWLVKLMEKQSGLKLR